MEGSLPPVTTGILTEETIDSYEVMGMAVMAARLLRNQSTGEMLVDIQQVCSKEIVGLELEPKDKEMANEHPSLTIQELLESNGWTYHFHLADMPWCVTAVL